MTLMIQSIHGSFVKEVQGLTLWSELEQSTVDELEDLWATGLWRLVARHESAA